MTHLKFVCSIVKGEMRELKHLNIYYFTRIFHTNFLQNNEGILLILRGIFELSKTENPKYFDIYSILIFLSICNLPFPTQKSPFNLLEFKY